MKLDYNLKLEQTQKLIITPELKLAITLLQYSALELQDHIQEELLSNPVLEVSEAKEISKETESEMEQSETEVSEGESGEDFSWEEYFKEMYLDRRAYPSEAAGVIPDYQPTVENCADHCHTMVDDLLEQLRLQDLTMRQYSAAAFLAGNLNHNGYLEGDLKELSQAIGVETEELEEALAVLQKLEPTGIGCRNLKECLLLQLEKLPERSTLAEEIVKQFLPAAADERFGYIATSLGYDEKQVEEAVALIRTLNPKPGSVYGEGDETRYIVPDVIAEKVEGEYVVTGNESDLPQLTISPFYQQMLRNAANDEKLSSFIKNKIEKAYWLIRSIEQRRLTLFKVAQQIIDIQKDFLDYGIKELRPLTLKEVAAGVGVHESTVSRATSNKYIQTPRGLFPLKFFFSSRLSGTDGRDHSSHSIKNYLQEIIEAENPAKPLSDQSLADLLQKEGVDISRRTVAKYREELSIPASYKRRKRCS